MSNRPRSGPGVTQLGLGPNPSPASPTTAAEPARTTLPVGLGPHPSPAYGAHERGLCADDELPERDASPPPSPSLAPRTPVRPARRRARLALVGLTIGVLALVFVNVRAWRSAQLAPAVAVASAAPGPSVERAPELRAVEPAPTVEPAPSASAPELHAAPALRAGSAGRVAPSAKPARPALPF